MSARALVTALLVVVLVVSSVGGDPVEAGLVASFARPAGTKEALPGLTRVGLLANPSHAAEQNELRLSRAAAERLRLQLVVTLEAARALSVTIPPALIARADHILE